MVRFAKDTQTVNAGEGIERKVLAFGKSVMLCEVCLKKGAVLPPHRHPHEQVSYMVSGSASFTVKRGKGSFIRGRQHSDSGQRRPHADGAGRQRCDRLLQSRPGGFPAIKICLNRYKRNGPGAVPFVSHILGGLENNKDKDLF